MRRCRGRRRARRRRSSSSASASIARHGGFGDAPKFPRPSELLFLLREHARQPATPQSRRARWCCDAARDGARRHARSHRRRLSSLLGRRRLARAAFREDAVRPGAAGARVSRSGAGVRRSVLCGGRRGHAALCAARDDRRRRRILFGRGRRQPPAGARRLRRTRTRKKARSNLWRADEIDALLGDDAAIVKSRFGIEPDGNAPQDPQQEFTGKNLLYVAQSIDEIATATGKTADEVVDAWTARAPAMFEERLRRPRPQRDDKILTAWNGLMIAAFARAARVLGRAPFIR